MGKTLSLSLPPALQNRRRGLMRRTTILHVLHHQLRPDGLSLCSPTRSASMDQRLSQPNLRNQAPLLAPGSPRTFAVVTTQTVSGSRPDLPKYPSHTPNLRHFELTPLEAPRLATMAPFRQPARQRTTHHRPSKGAHNGASTSHPTQGMAPFAQVGFEPTASGL